MRRKHIGTIKLNIISYHIPSFPFFSLLKPLPRRRLHISLILPLTNASDLTIDLDWSWMTLTCSRTRTHIRTLAKVEYHDLARMETTSTRQEWYPTWESNPKLVSLSLSLFLSRFEWQQTSSEFRFAGAVYGSRTDLRGCIASAAVSNLQAVGRADRG